MTAEGRALCHVIGWTGWFTHGLQPRAVLCYVSRAWLNWTPGARAAAHLTSFAICCQLL
uniref:Uncharacterized protein n=1 Tax=Rhizophora mucronata TaxID=61149 RepID=A0A2P2NJJ1_RHIMU